MNLILYQVQHLEEKTTKHHHHRQDEFYDIDKLELLEVMNVVPTESEAWDIVQLEEIERELME